MHPTDPDLVQRVRAGDADAFALLVEKHYPACLRFALRMLGNRADAEEAVQDAFVRAYRAMHRYDERNRLQAWLFQILVNRCRSALRRRQRWGRLLSTGPREEPVVEAEEPAEPGWSPEIQRALQRLRPALREALLLKYVEDQSYEEIAAATGAGVSAVKMWVKRAREQLRDLLQEVENG